MDIVRSKYRGDDDGLRIIPIGDLHVGHVNYKEDIVKNSLNMLNNSTRCILMGDLAECATKTSVGKGLLETDMTPRRQREYLIELLRPFKQYIDGAVIGNHEERVAKDTSIDLVEDICKTLEIPYLHYSGIVKYNWNGVAYSVFMWHGHGGGATIGGAMNKLEKMSNRTFADIQCMGHVHKLAKSDKIINVPDLRNMKVVPTQQHFILTGSALDYNDGYAEQMGLEGRGLGFPIIDLSGKKGDKKITVTLWWGICPLQ